MDTFTKEELEYQQEYEACLNDGKVSTSERRLLDRLAKSLGLSQEQINKIESAVNSPLSEPEREYLEEFQACMADDPDISPSTRRLLNRLASSLNLTKEQVDKIEKIALPSNNEKKVVPPPIPTQNSNEEIKNEDTCDPDADFSIAYLKGDILTVCIAGTGQSLSIDMRKCRNQSVADIFRYVESLDIQQDYLHGYKNYGESFLSSNLQMLRETDAFIISRTSVKSFKNSLQASGILNRVRIYKEAALFATGKLAYDQGFFGEGRYRVVYENLELKLEIGDGVYEYLEENIIPQSYERDLKFMILGLILRIQVRTGDLKDFLPLDIIGYDIEIILQDNNGNKYFYPILGKNLTIPTRKEIAIIPGVKNQVGLKINDEIIPNLITLSSSRKHNFTLEVGSFYFLNLEIKDENNRSRQYIINNLIK